MILLRNPSTYLPPLPMHSGNVDIVLKNVGKFQESKTKMDFYIRLNFSLIHIMGCKLLNKNKLPTQIAREVT